MNVLALQRLKRPSLLLPLENSPTFEFRVGKMES